MRPVEVESRVAARSRMVAESRWGRAARTADPVAPDQVRRVPAHAEGIRGAAWRAPGPASATEEAQVKAAIEAPAEEAVSRLMELTDEYEGMADASPAGRAEAQHLADQIARWTRECERLATTTREGARA